MNSKTGAQEAEHRAATASNVREELGLQLLLMGPLVGTYLADLCLFYIDHAIVGRLGADELGAVGLSGMLFFEFVIIASAVLSIIGVIVGNAFGAGDSSLVAHAVRKGLVFALGLSPPLMLLSWWMMDLLALTGQEPVIIELGEDYVRAAVWMMPAALGFVVLRSFVTGLSRPGVVTLVFTLALPVNLVLNWWLVFGGLGVPALGVAGAGYASAIVTWMMFFGLVFYINQHRFLAGYRVFSELFAPNPELTRRIWKLGLPVAGMTIIEGSFFNLVIIAVGLFGTVALAANQIVINTIAFAWTIGMSIGEAAAVRVSQEYGHRRALAATRAGWLSLGASGLCGLVFMLALLAAPSALATIFIDIDDQGNQPVMELVITLGVMGALIAFFDVVQVVAARCLRGLEDTLVPMLLTALGYWVLALPIGIVLGFVLDYGVVGLWAGMTTGLGLSCVLVVVRWQILSRRYHRQALQG